MSTGVGGQAVNVLPWRAAAKAFQPLKVLLPKSNITLYHLPPKPLEEKVFNVFNDHVPCVSCHAHYWLGVVSICPVLSKFMHPTAVNQWGKHIDNVKLNIVMS